MKLKIISAVILGAAVTNAANAQNGFYFGGSLGQTTLEHNLTRNLGSNPPALPVPDAGGSSLASDTDFTGSLRVGYKQGMGNGFFGAEAFYSDESASTKNINGVLITEIDLNNSYGIKLLGGFNITDKTSFYVHGGYSVVDFDINNSYTFAPPKRSDSTDESGFTYGVGIENQINNNMNFFVEYSALTDVDFTPIPEVAGMTGRLNDNDLDLSKFEIDIKYYF